MTLRSSILYAEKIFFSRAMSSSGEGGNHGHRSLFGALFCIGICLVPLITVLVVSEGMISGITGRIIRLSTQDLSVYVDSDSEFAESEENFVNFSESFLEVDGVTGAYPQIEGTALAAGTSYRTGATVRAVPRDVFVKNEGFASLFTVTEGTADLSKKKSAVLGQKIAELLSVHPGDTVRLIMVKHSDSGVVIPKVSVYKVEGIVSSGYQELDALWFFIPLDEGFSVMAGTDAEFTVGLTTDSTFSPALKNIEFEVQKHILSKMNSKAISGAWVSTWMDLNRSKFENFSSTKILLLLIMLLIVLVASVNISSALVMVVMERRKEIAILKSTGATASGITASFLMVGFCCGAGGVLLGLPFGLLVSININGIIRGMERIMNCAVKFWNILVNGSSAAGNVHLLDPGFYLQEIPVTIPVKELLLIVLGTLVLSVVVSALPAIKAGQEKPLDTLRKM